MGRITIHITVRRDIVSTPRFTFLIVWEGSIHWQIACIRYYELIESYEIFSISKYYIPSSNDRKNDRDPF